MSFVDLQWRNHSNRFAVAIAITERARWGREELAAQLMVMVGEGGRSVALVVKKGSFSKSTIFNKAVCPVEKWRVNLRPRY